MDLQQGPKPWDHPSSGYKDRCAPCSNMWHRHGFCQLKRRGATGSSGVLTKRGRSFPINYRGVLTNRPKRALKSFTQGPKETCSARTFVDDRSRAEATRVPLGEVRGAETHEFGVCSVREDFCRAWTGLAACKTLASPCVLVQPDGWARRTPRRN